MELMGTTVLTVWFTLIGVDGDVTAPGAEVTALGAVGAVEGIAVEF